MRHLILLGIVLVVLIPGMARPQGEPLGPEFRVNTYTPYAHLDPAVAADSAGDFVVVWRAYLEDGAAYGVFGQRYGSSGDPLGPEFRVNSFTTSTQFAQSIASDAAGNFVVVWASPQDGSGLGVFGQRYAAAGEPLGSEFRINTSTTGAQSNPSVAAAADGAFVVVWNSLQNGVDLDVFGQRYASSGAPLGGEFRANTYTSHSQSNPRVAASGAGDFVVVWTSDFEDGSDSGVFGQRYASGGAPLGAEFRVNSQTALVQNSPAVAADAAGDFVVAWNSQEQGSVYFDVFAQRYSASGAPLGLEFRVNADTTGSQQLPSVAADAAGNFIISWSSLPTLADEDVFGQRYSASGIPLGGPFRVNTYTTSDQQTPSVAAASSGDFVVVWAGNGIFGQRFGQILPVGLTRFTVE